MILSAENQRLLARRAAEYMHSRRQAAYSTAPWSALPYEDRQSLVAAMQAALFPEEKPQEPCYCVRDFEGTLLHDGMGTQQGAETLAQRQVVEEGERMATVHEVYERQLAVFTERVVRTAERRPG